ncbi:MAG: hypothetical protein K2X66_14450 [Cyanobacteria bacterium]|nr:hypothetical protein [Cyanobacteriota bacterium]
MLSLSPRFGSVTLQQIGDKYDHRFRLTLTDEDTALPEATTLNAKKHGDGSKTIDFLRQTGNICREYGRYDSIQFLHPDPNTHDGEGYRSTKNLAALITLFSRAKTTSPGEVWTVILESLQSFFKREKFHADGNAEFQKEKVESFTQALARSTHRSQVLGDFLSQYPQEKP